MKKGKIITNQDEIYEILNKYKKIAVVGLSPNPEKISNMVGKYLKENGYKIFPIYPKEKEILGEKVYSSLLEIKEEIDILDLFRKPDQILEHTNEAIQKKVKVFWMQLGIENNESAEILINAGIDVIMNRCIKIEHQAQRNIFENIVCKIK